jgi:DNA sulfur modification protein DndC
MMRAIDRTRDALEENANAHWIIGFSGGKDSTALLKVFASAVRQARKFPNIIDVIYCDTGVENPVLDAYVKTLFTRLTEEFEQTDAPFRMSILKAPLSNRFFVKLIGRGYPPPTNSFRWCTKNLRIRPVAAFIKNAAYGTAIVALGMRRAESQQRDRSLMRGGDDVWQMQIEGGRQYRLLLPIFDLDVYEVWDSVFSLPYPISINPNALAVLYRGASGECPIIKAPHAPPCASGRFGCWTCTVVRKDRSSESLVQAGHRHLLPYLEFRNWLGSIRNDYWRRWPVRRNGTPGLGPFTLKARSEIREKLRHLEKIVGMVLLPEEEDEEIERLWAVDCAVERLAQFRLLSGDSPGST